MSDAELLHSPDPAAFGVFYDRHAALVLGWFMHRTLRSDVSADLCADTFLTALDRRQHFDPARDNAAPWLLTIAHNHLRRYLRAGRISARAQGKLHYLTPDHSSEELAAVEALVDLPALRASIDSALSCLPGALADAVRLHRLQGMSYAEVAGELGISEGNARVRVSRGLERLAKHRSLWTWLVPD